MALAELIDCFEHLTPASLDQLEQLYSADALFKDPFNEVQGAPAIRAIFAHMFQQVQAPRFAVLSQLAAGDEAMLVWEMHYQSPRLGAQCIRGSSHLRFAADGRVCYHRDYWDSSEELYQQLPLLGPLLRWLRRQLAAPPAAAGH